VTAVANDIMQQFYAMSSVAMTLLANDIHLTLLQDNTLEHGCMGSDIMLANLCDFAGKTYSKLPFLGKSLT
jgi:hypothetical protein